MNNYEHDTNGEGTYSGNEWGHYGQIDMELREQFLKRIGYPIEEEGEPRIREWVTAIQTNQISVEHTITQFIEKYDLIDLSKPGPFGSY